MSVRKSTASTAPAGAADTLRVWLGSWMADRRLRRGTDVAPPRRQPIQAAKPRRGSSFWAARFAVRAGISLEDFLRHRLTGHLAGLSVPSSRLPVTFSIGRGGDVVATPSPSAEARPPWLDPYLDGGALALAPEIQLCHADAARLGAQIDGQRARVDALAAELQERARREPLVDPDDRAAAQRMGRPPVPPPIGLTLQGFALTLLLPVAWQVALTALRAPGLELHRLIAYVERDPLGLASAALLAAGAATALFLFAHLAAGALASVAEPRRRALVAGAGLALLGGTAWAVAAAVATHGDPRYGRAVLFLADLGIPFAAAWLFRLGGRLASERARAQEQARAWDTEHHRRLVDVSRCASALAEEERVLAALESQRAGRALRAHELRLRRARVERLAAEAVQAEQHELALAVQAVAAAAELDRYEYVRQAAARGPSTVHEPVAGPVRAARAEREHNLGLAG